MTYRSTHIDDDERDALAGVSASSSSARRAGQTAEIIPFPAPMPPPWAGEDEDAGCWESIGVLACRLVGAFDRPRLLVMTQTPEGET